MGFPSVFQTPKTLVNVAALTCLSQVQLHSHANSLSMGIATLIPTGPWAPPAHLLPSQRLWTMLSLLLTIVFPKTG